MEPLSQPSAKHGTRADSVEDDLRFSDPHRQPFKVVSWQAVDLSQTLVIMGFPSIGLVGSIATAHLVESLELREVGAVLSPVLPPAAVIHEGLGTSPIRIYLGDMVCGVDGRCDQLCVVHSDIAPKSNFITSMAYALVSWAKERNARQLVCLEGVQRETAVNEDAPIYGVASDPDGRRLLEKLEVASLEDGLLTGIGGVALYAARALETPALCLLAPTHEDFPDARGAARLLESLDPLVPLVPIDTRALYVKAQALEVAFREQYERSNRAVKELSGRADIMYG